MGLFASALVLHTQSVFESFCKPKQHSSEKQYFATVQWLLVRDQARWHLLFFRETNGFHFLLKDVIPYLQRILLISNVNGFLLGYDDFTTREIFLTDSNLSLLVILHTIRSPRSSNFLGCPVLGNFSIEFGFKASINSQCRRMMKANNFSNFWKGKTIFSQYFYGISLFIR